MEKFSFRSISTPQFWIQFHRTSSSQRAQWTNMHILVFFFFSVRDPVCGTKGQVRLWFAVVHVKLEKFKLCIFLGFLAHM